MENEFIKLKVEAFHAGTPSWYLNGKLLPPTGGSAASKHFKYVKSREYGLDYGSGNNFDLSYYFFFKPVFFGWVKNFHVYKICKERKMKDPNTVKNLRYKARFNTPANGDWDDISVYF